MKSINAKHFVLLVASPMLLLGFGLLWPSKPTFRLKSVQFGIETKDSFTGRPKKPVTTVDVVTEYSDPSIWRRYSGRDIYKIDSDSALYIEDKHGIRYGQRQPGAKDTKKYRPFVSTGGGTKRLQGIRWSGVADSEEEIRPYELRFYMPLYQIPKSAGKLTLKTIIEGGTTTNPMRLPISIVVRE